MRLAHQLRGESRKLVHPLTGLTMLSVAVGASVLQAEHVNDPYPGPSIQDFNGCLRIALLQHATTLGFVVAAVLAAVGTADEAGRGALADILIREPRRARLVALKLTTVFMGLLVSIATTTAALLITHVLKGNHHSVRAGSKITDTLVDVSASLPVVAWAVALALTIAMLTRSVIATIAVTITLFYLPLTLLRDTIMWVTPTRWIVEWLHLDPLGEGVDYIADNSPYDHRGIPALVGGALIITALLAAAAVLPALVTRAASRPKERDT